MSPTKKVWSPNRMLTGRKRGLGQFGPLFLVIVSVGCLGLFYTVREFPRSFPSGTADQKNQDTDPCPEPDPVCKLISAIKETARLAAEGIKDENLGTDLELWHIAHSCRSRLELKSMYSRRRFAPDVDPNPRWEEVLREYSKLHRICRHRVGNVRDYFMSKNSSIPGCKFAIADYSEAGGLGNKIVAITNTILYSILKQRVVLVPIATLVPALMCEPFPGSSWVLEAGTGMENNFPVPPWENAHISLWNFNKDVYEELDNEMGGAGDDASTLRASSSSSKLYSASMVYQQYQPQSRFYCDTEQERFSEVVWMYFTGCLYITPRFFSIPSLRPTLEGLFPDRMALTHMVRSVMLPEDVVWERLVISDFEHLKGADRRVGVQIRYRRNLEQYEQMNTIINQRFMQCAVENGVIPPASGENRTSEAAEADAVPQGIVKIFVACLFTGFSDMISDTYLGRPTSTGEVVELVQLSSEGAQSYGLEIDRESLVEIMMLSFSDDLFITPLSTFGGLAQSYGALVPWLLDFRFGDEFGPCERGQTVDLCYQEADFVYSCPYNKDVNGRVISEVVPYIKDCLPIDTQLNIPPGFQLITNASIHSTILAL